MSEPSRLEGALERARRDVWNDSTERDIEHIIEAAYEWLLVMKAKPVDEEFDELLTVLAWIDLGAINRQSGEWVGVCGDARLVGEEAEV